MRRAQLEAAAATFGTPLYVYDLPAIRQRIADVRRVFGQRFSLSYAVKANCNVSLLRALDGLVDTLDTSSIGEVERGLLAGWNPSLMSFSGPAKRTAELHRAVEVGVADLVCESPRDLDVLQALAAEQGRSLKVLIRINPAHCPPGFGVRMSGKPAQFGIDEEDLPAAVEHLSTHCPDLQLCGFHIYSGTNALTADTLDENFRIFITLFEHASQLFGIRPEKLIFGAAFGIPYAQGDAVLDLDELAALLNPQIDALKDHPLLGEAHLALETGRYLVGQAGRLLTRVIAAKRSRGTEIRLCDAGFNNHLAACGMMGTIIRRNWAIERITARDDEDQSASYTLTGSLCTTIDQLATRIELPPIHTGDLLSIPTSGAYGFSASPHGFISHPVPREVLWDGQALREITDHLPTVHVAPAGREGARREGIVVLGPPGSGTALVRRLLDAHPDIHCPPETQLLRSSAAMLREIPLSNGLSVGVRSGLASGGTSEDTVVARVRELVLSFFREAAAGAGKRRWAERTAYDSFHLDHVLQLTQGLAHYVVVLRHPLDTVCSIAERCEIEGTVQPELQGYVEGADTALEGFAQAWVDVTSGLLDLAEARPDEVFVLAYEQLLENPAATITALFGFLDEPTASERILASLHASIDASSVGRFRSLAPATQAQLLAIVQPTMLRAGYPTEEG